MTSTTRSRCKAEYAHRVGRFRVDSGEEVDPVYLKGVSCEKEEAYIAGCKHLAERYKSAVHLFGRGVCQQLHTETQCDQERARHVRCVIDRVPVVGPPERRQRSRSPWAKFLGTILLLGKLRVLSTVPVWVPTARQDHGRQLVAARR